MVPSPPGAGLPGQGLAGDVTNVLEDVQAQIGIDNDPAGLLSSDPEGDRVADTDALLGDEPVVDEEGTTIVLPEGATVDDAGVEGA